MRPAACFSKAGLRNAVLIDRSAQIGAPPLRGGRKPLASHGAVDIVFDRAHHRFNAGLVLGEIFK
jgi:hypothetical protein